MSQKGPFGVANGTFLGGAAGQIFGWCGLPGVFPIASNSDFSALWDLGCVQCSLSGVGGGIGWVCCARDCAAGSSLLAVY